MSTNASPRNKHSILKKENVSEGAKQLQSIVQLQEIAKLQETAQLQKAFQAFLAKYEKKSSKAKTSSPDKIGKAKLVKASFEAKNNEPYDNSLRVTATAYTSHAAQTDSTPNIAAWGDRLRPGMKVIAVSRDLLKVHGLKHKQKVRIKGLEGEYVVLDKMNKRWRKKIDIYMGMNKRKAFKWGRRKVEILWNQI